MSEPNTEFLNALLHARRVVFTNGDMVQRIDDEWYAYKHEGPVDESQCGGVSLVDDDNCITRFVSLQAAWTALQGNHRLWKQPSWPPTPGESRDP